MGFSVCLSTKFALINKGFLLDKIAFRTLVFYKTCYNFAKMTHIFIYGTLKKGQPNHHRMLDKSEGKAEFLGRARTVDKYPLVIAGKYNIPFLLNVPGEGSCVQGEIYSVDDNMLKFLDWFEDCPRMYQRTRVLLEVEEWTGEGEKKPEVGSITEAFMYSTTTYQPEMLQNAVFESYDANGDHGLQYVAREARSTN